MTPRAASRELPAVGPTVLSLHPLLVQSQINPEALRHGSVTWFRKLLGCLVTSSPYAVVSCATMEVTLENFREGSALPQACCVTLGPFLLTLSSIPPLLKMGKGRVCKSSHPLLWLCDSRGFRGVGQMDQSFILCF